jgi:hypothetical protein
LRLAVAVSVAAITLLAPLFGGVAGAADKGLQTDITWGTSPADQIRTAGLIKDVGAQWVRLDVSWADAEPQPGVYDATTLAMTDTAVNLVRASGAKILMMIDQSPTWESGNSNKDAPPSNMADYAKFVNFIAARYAGTIAAYEIWNEENSQRFWPTATGPDPARYAQMLEASYPAVKSADPSAKVIFGAVAFNDYHFLESVYAAAPDIGKYFDVMATHPYTTGAAPPEAVTLDPDGRVSEYSFPAYREVRAELLAHGDDKPIWFTEFGWSTNTAGGALGGVSEQTQADYIARAYRYIEADPYVQVAITYNFRNNYWASDANDWDDQLGLMHTDFSPKPAYYAFKAYTPGAGAGAAASPAPTATSTSSPTATSTSSPAAAAAPAQPASARPAATAAIAPTSTTLALATSRVRAGAASRKTASLRCPSVILGHVTGAHAGAVDIVFDRGGPGHWHRVKTLHSAVGRSGNFSVRAGCGLGAAIRAKAHYRGTPQTAPSTSGYVYLTERRAGR